MSPYPPAPQTNPPQYEAHESSLIITQSIIPTTPLPDDLSCPDTESLSAHAHILLISRVITASLFLKINYAKNVDETDRLRNHFIVQLKQQIKAYLPSRKSNKRIRLLKRLNLVPFKTAIDLHNKEVLYIHSINTDTCLFKIPPQSPNAPTFIDSAKSNITTANTYIHKAKTYLISVQNISKMKD